MKTTNFAKLNQHNLLQGTHQYKNSSYWALKYFFLYETADGTVKSNFLNWLCQKYSRVKYLGSKKSKSVIALNCIFKLNTSSTDPFVKQKKQT